MCLRVYWRWYGGKDQRIKFCLYWLGTGDWSEISCCIYFLYMDHESQYINTSFIIIGNIFYLMIQEQQYFIGVLNIWNFNYFNLEYIPLFLIVTDNFSYHHHLFIIIPDLQCSYSRYMSFFSFLLIFIHDHLTKNQISIAMIILPYLYISKMELIHWWP